MTTANGEHSAQVCAWWAALDPGHVVEVYVCEVSGDVKSGSTNHGWKIGTVVERTESGPVIELELDPELQGDTSLPLTEVSSSQAWVQIKRRDSSRETAQLQDEENESDDASHTIAQKKKTTSSPKTISASLPKIGTFRFKIEAQQASKPHFIRGNIAKDPLSVVGEVFWLPNTQAHQVSHKAKIISYNMGKHFIIRSSRSVVATAVDFTTVPFMRVIDDENGMAIFPPTVINPFGTHLQKCDICMEWADKSKRKNLSFDCHGNKYHEKCVREYAHTMIDSGKVYIRCPDPSCKRDLGLRELKTCMDRDHYVTLLKRTKEIEQSSLHNMQEDESLKKFAIMKHNAGEALRPCPKCFALTEKNLGCDHMKCFRCGHDWSWKKQEGSIVTKDSAPLGLKPSIVRLEVTEIPMLPCPRCKTLTRQVTKNNRVSNDITCSACRLKWCWHCRQVLPSSASWHYKAGDDVFGCNGLRHESEYPLTVRIFNYSLMVAVLIICLCCLPGFLVTLPLFWPFYFGMRRHERGRRVLQEIFLIGPDQHVPMNARILSFVIFSAWPVIISLLLLSLLTVIVEIFATIFVGLFFLPFWLAMSWLFAWSPWVRWKHDVWRQKFKDWERQKGISDLLVFMALVAVWPLAIILVLGIVYIVVVLPLSFGCALLVHCFRRQPKLFPKELQNTPSEAESLA